MGGNETGMHGLLVRTKGQLESECKLQFKYLVDSKYTSCVVACIIVSVTRLARTHRPREVLVVDYVPHLHHTCHQQHPLHSLPHGMQRPEIASTRSM